jgi:hypothetical protein
MVRRSPPRKVTYFELVPPRLARNTIIESTFEVGRRFRRRGYAKRHGGRPASRRATPRRFLLQDSGRVGIGMDDPHHVGLVRSVWLETLMANGGPQETVALADQRDRRPSLAFIDRDRAAFLV